MRRNVSLYIANQRVDLDNQSFILFNYTQEDLNNPTIVKNSYTQSISVKGTKNNNRIFGNIFNLDRMVSYNGGQSGADFNPMVKTPFVIYNEMNEVLESGYVKLNSVKRRGVDITYNITLYGGLGSFLYSLAYDGNGDKRTLADLDFLGTDNTASELDFTINANAVMEAWNTAQSGVSSLWNVINFAPAYNGLPSGNFAANKALMIPTEQGLQYQISGYTTKDNYALLNMANNQDEWAVKDLRSYLQRPIFSINALLNAISNPANNGGYEVDLSSIATLDYKNLWMTLPLIPSIGSVHQESGALSLNLSSSQTTSKEVARANVVGSVPSGSKITANINVKLQFNMANNTYATLSTTAQSETSVLPQSKNTAIFVQLLAYTSGNVLVGGSKVKAIFPAPLTGTTDAQTMATTLGYTPLWANGGYDNYISSTTFTKKSASIYEFERELGFSCEANDVDHYILHVTSFNYTALVGTNGKVSISSVTGGNSSVANLFHDFTTAYAANGALMSAGATANSITYSSTSELRSGARITKSMLLSTTQTPADYLLSFCKVFGLAMVYDSALRKVTIVQRNDLYQDEVIDLTKRIDKSQENEIEPLVFNSKWYNFALDSVGGAFMDEYGKTNGRIYGSQRVNTGYDFNADSVDMMNGIVFKGAASVLGKSRYFNTIFKQQYFQPSPFVDKGNTYTLWNADGDTLNTEISTPPSTAIVGYYNTDNPGYDIADAVKLELCDSEKKGLDGAGVLVYYNGKKNYPYFKVTDDLAIMSVLTDGQPCWIISAGSENGVDLPVYSAYKVADSVITDSLDFGIPAELDIPGATYNQESTIYERCWRAYLEDRFSINTKVVRVKVNLNGLQVNNSLLRKFYWFDNSLWSLNKITNYSLTTWDSAECEFIQVQNKDNYLNGQI